MTHTAAMVVFMVQHVAQLQMQQVQCCTVQVRWFSPWGHSDFGLNSLPTSTLQPSLLLPVCSFSFSHAVAVTVGESSGITVDSDLGTNYIKMILSGADKSGELLEQAELDYSLTPGSVFSST